MQELERERCGERESMEQAIATVQETSGDSELCWQVGGHKRNVCGVVFTNTYIYTQYFTLGPMWKVNKRRDHFLAVTNQEPYRSQKILKMNIEMCMGRQSFTVKEYS